MGLPKDIYDVYYIYICVAVMVLFKAIRMFPLTHRHTNKCLENFRLVRIVLYIICKIYIYIYLREEGRGGGYKERYVSMMKFTNPQNLSFNLSLIVKH